MVTVGVAQGRKAASYELFSSTLFLSHSATVIKMDEKTLL